MGHADVENFSIFFIKRLFARGKLTLKECVDFFLTKEAELEEKIERAELRGKNEVYLNELRKKREQFGYNASEGTQYDRGMVSNGFLTVALYHKENGIVEPIIETNEQKELWRQMDDNELDAQEDWDVFDDGIKWKFAEGGRQKYLNKEITHLRTVED